MKVIEQYFQWCCLLLTILQNEIRDFLLSFEFGTLGSEIKNKLQPVVELAISNIGPGL